MSPFSVTLSKWFQEQHLYMGCQILPFSSVICCLHFFFSGWDPVWMTLSMSIVIVPVLFSQTYCRGIMSIAPFVRLGDTISQKISIFLPLLLGGYYLSLRYRSIIRYILWDGHLKTSCSLYYNELLYTYFWKKYTRK